MDLDGLRALIGGRPLTDLAACRAELDHIRVIRSALDTRELQIVARLDEIAAAQPSVFPEDEVAKASKSSLNKSTKVRQRKKACDDVPQLADALANGDTTGDRVDTFAKATNGLTPDEMAKVAEHGDTIAAAAANSTERQYRETIERIIGRAKTDDGLDQLARQRANSRFRSWTGADGMWNFAGRYDPVRGTELDGRIRNAIETLFHGKTPDDAPTDPIERQEHLAALALLALSEGKGTSGLPDVTVLIDEKTLTSGHRHEHTVLDAGLGRFGLPIETVRRWACLGTITPVVVGADGVRLFLGRETTTRQPGPTTRTPRPLPDVRPVRRPVRTHPSPPRLVVRTASTDLTDVDNLLPLCGRHHHLVHEGGWQLHLAADRTLTIIRPGGHITTTGPPTIRAA